MSSKRDDEAYVTAINDRMKKVLAQETDHDDAEVVETRLRNMIYGTNKK